MTEMHLHLPEEGKAVSKLFNLRRAIMQIKQGLKKTQVLLKKPAGRLNAGFFTGFSGKTGFLKQVFSPKMFICGGQFRPKCNCKICNHHENR
jgi:hypothetical protein